MRIILILISIIIFTSCSDEVVNPSISGYWYGEPIRSTERNDLEGRKNRKFYSLRMDNGHFITKQSYVIDGSLESRVVYGFWQRVDNFYIVQQAAIVDKGGEYWYGDCHIDMVASQIMNLTEDKFVYKSKDSGIYYSSTRISEKDGLAEIDINDDLYKTMYLKLVEFSESCA